MHNTGHASVPATLAAALETVAEMDGEARVHELAKQWNLARPLAANGRLDASHLFSDQPTRHQVVWGQRRGWTHCILDALMLPFFDGQPAQVETTTPLLGETIRLRVTSDGVASSHPDALITVSTAPWAGDDVRQACCPFILAFTSREEYERWRRQNPQVVNIALPLVQAWQLAGELVRGAHAVGRQQGQPADRRDDAHCGCGCC